MDLNGFAQQVKRNCDISDARSWGFYSMCGLLTRLRDLYRTEHGRLPWETIPRPEIAEWISSRERLWMDLEQEELRSLEIAGTSYDPFDINGIGRVLAGTGLVYGAGYGVYGKETFFLGRLADRREVFDYQVFISGKELCRDLSSAPAMLQGRCVYIRLDAIRTLLWDKFHELQAHRYGGLLEEFFSAHGIAKTEQPSESLHERIDGLIREASEVFLLHEIGEAFEDEDSEEWNAIIRSGGNKRGELHLRAIKDLLADTSEVGPLKRICGERNRPRLLLFMTFLDGIRREIFPEMRNAFQRFMETNDWSLIEKVRIAGYEKGIALRRLVHRLWHEQRDADSIAEEVRKQLAAQGPG